MELLTRAGEYVLRFQSGDLPSWLTVLGKSGCGKTHVCHRVWEHLRDKSTWLKTAYPPEKIYWPRFVEELRRSGAGEGNALDRLLDMASKWPVLFLDDVGAELDKTGFATEKLNTLLGSRVGKWTILTSNLSLEDVSKIDTRHADRMIREPGNQCIILRCLPYSLRKGK